MTRFLIAVAVVCAAFAQQAKEGKQKGPNPPFHLPDSVELQKDIVYARYGSREVHLDLYLPKSRSGAIPAVVYIHGGGWRNGSRSAFARQAAHMATKGVAGACIEYRLSGEAKWPAAIHDSKAAVRWVRANAAKYGLDPNRIGAAGGSAGGHLAALLGTTGGRKDLEGDGGNAGVSSRVIAVAAFNPAVDLVSFAKLRSENANSSVEAFLGSKYEANPKLWELATPLTHVSKESAAFLFLHGDADTTVPHKQSADMLAKLKAVGVSAEIMTAPGASHGYFNSPPWYQPTLEKMEQFFLRTLKK